ncbi:hypothetical protein JXM83_04065 [Candidatus Woesearchaeota archaeon]|nr:hypothetical protein [Candidatus Woesearchaeota archaeon]
MGSIVGFNFKKISVERTKDTSGKLSISNNISVKDVSETKFTSGASSQQGLVFNFIFESKYEPEVALIHLEGSLLYMTEDKEAKTVIDSWKKDKKIDAKIMERILNHVLAKSNIQALTLARDVNLPPPFPLPKIKSGNKQ